MTTRTRTTTPSNEAKKATPAKPAPAKRTNSRPARTTRTKAPAPTRPVSLVKLTKKPRRRPLLQGAGRRSLFLSDAQIYATHTARRAGLPIHQIRSWRDHRDNTATKPLADGSTLHYDHTTRTLTWQAICPMGAIHEYRITTPSTATAARVHADRCQQPHADLNKIKPLTREERQDLGILPTPGWARPDVLGEPATESVPVPLPDRHPRALADHLTHSHSSTAETQPLSQAEIAAGIAVRTPQVDTAKEHPQP
ncbi:hypothetical protein ABZT16_45850 [Streptomyces flaveolus]|uniref:hypothetical protein n=1 Tax=Streptomyces TaxID=1883 RepID=UPI0033B1EF74